MAGADGHRSTKPAFDPFSEPIDLPQEGAQPLTDLFVGPPATPPGPPPSRPPARVIESVAPRRPAEEERRFPRWHVNLSAKGQWWVSRDEPCPFDATIQNLSLGGAMLRCNGRIPANSTVQLAVKVGLFKKLELRGQVRWWHRLGEQFDIGLQFDEDVGAQDIRRLANRPTEG